MAGFSLFTPLLSSQLCFSFLLNCVNKNMEIDLYHQNTVFILFSFLFAEK